MKVKLLKDHLEHKQGEEIEVTEERANYFIRCGIAKAKAYFEDATPKKKKQTNAPEA